ncbi:MAG TPA: DUF192 domain-containing protein [Candidatus Sulfotelmatobacter sp.]|nr:DUF192 domain-containing protein [Candidatus Sulfotelmatobacter sp.]
MRNLFFLILAIFVLLVLFFLNSGAEKQNNKPTITILNKTFVLDVAKTADEKEIGLAKYDKLPADMAMLFPFSGYGYYHFWMKDMKFPIDIIFIKDNKIVDIFVNVPNPSPQNENLQIYTPKTKSNYVLEINANVSKRYNFKIGDTVKISL